MRESKDRMSHDRLKTLQVRGKEGERREGERREGERGGERLYRYLLSLLSQFQFSADRITSFP
jgi:hypothetical protein